MTDEINYQNNPLHGLGLKQLLTEIVDHYGFEILYAYLNINCFKTKPSIESSIKFLKKTDWARQKVEIFYLYKFKNLPRPSSEQFKLPPRERIIPEGVVPGEPAELSLEDAEQEREKQAKKAAEYSNSGRNRSAKNYNKGSNKYGSNRSGGSGSRDGFREVSSDNQSDWKPKRKPAPSHSRNDTDDSDPWAKWKK